MFAQEKSVMGQFLSKSMRQDTAAKSIEDLPDDALYVIFKNLDSTELICTVSLVCRRWRDLAFHHSVWAYRHVKATDIGRQSTLQEILINIPALHTLDFTHTTVEDSTIETILRSRIRIRNLKLYDCTIHSRDLYSVSKVLNHLSENLEGLNIELQNGFLQSSTKFNLNKMANLRRLTLIGDLNGKIDEFNLDCPELISLDISRFNSTTHSYSDPRRYSFASNLINATKGKLKELRLPFYCYRTIINSVELCNFLTAISLQLEYLGVVSHLPLVESLTVHCDSSANPPLTWIRPKNLNALVLYLRKPKETSINFLNNINTRSLTLISDNLCRELEHFCSRDINRLILRCYFLRLRHLTVTICRNTSMPNLEYLDVSTCFLGKGVPPKILAALKRALPGLVVRSDRFVGYRKEREARNDVDCGLQESTDCSDTE